MHAPSTSAPPAPRRRARRRTDWRQLALSAAALAVALAVLVPAASWAIARAHWSIIPANLHLLLVGTYPTPRTWRVALAFAVLALGSLLALPPRAPGSASLAPPSRPR